MANLGNCQENSTRIGAKLRMLFLCEQHTEHIEAFSFTKQVEYKGIRRYVWYGIRKEY